LGPRKAQCYVPSLTPSPALIARVVKWMQRLLFLYLKEATKHHWGLAKMIDLLDHLIPKWPAICGFTGAPGVPNIYLHKAPLSSPVPKHPRPSVSRRCAACRGFWSGFWTPVPACATNHLPGCIYVICWSFLTCFFEGITMDCGRFLVATEICGFESEMPFCRRLHPRIFIH
jgi:hypothetical protein